MSKRYKRKKYLVRPQTQLRYIAFSVLPALLMSLFCTYTLIRQGEGVVREANEKPLVHVYSMRQALLALDKETPGGSTAAERSKLHHELDSVKAALEHAYIGTLTKWNQAKRYIFLVLALVLFFVALVALVYSHRIAGPLYRIKMVIDTLSEGKNTAPIQLRRHDEFTEIAVSLERLRNRLHRQGFLK